MDWKLELIIIPVTDVDRAKAFYVDQVGFHADHDQTVDEEIRFVQLTPPGSACSIAFGRGLTDAEPGSVRGLQIVVADADVAHDELVARGVQTSDVDPLTWGRFVYFSDPDGNAWALQELPQRSGDRVSGADPQRSMGVDNNHRRLRPTRPPPMRSVAPRR